MIETGSFENGKIEVMVPEMLERSEATVAVSVDGVNFIPVDLGADHIIIN